MSRRQPRQRQAKGASVVGQRFTATVGPVAHGGHCIVRLPEPQSRVVFTRHALPGEKVIVEITEGTEGDRFWRGDAVEVLTAAPDRVPAPCQYAGPDLCGGCDFQHVALPAQRDLKATVIREQLVRLAGMSPEDPRVAGLVVEGVPTGASDALDGLHWRTRMQYVDLPGGTHGLRVHRSRDVVEIDECLIAHPDAREPSAALVSEQVHGRDFTVAADGFWQVHPGAPETLVDTVLALLDPQPGEKALDLYSGVGLFAAFLAERVGESGRVVAVEGDRRAAEHAKANLREFRRATVEAGSVDRVLVQSFDEPFDLVVLDPPREGARRKVVEQIVDRAPRGVAYVACDPAALARDVAIFAEHGYALSSLRAFDLFPMTHHVECVALLTKSGSDLR
ncbi:class I SAM-dependent RNA methyltransferase [Nocardioides sp.]|uniref:class I SAM-dependent RNA methyltransferase n=1 Tax=Nocardioides sp. TaxID=35761 RepID=UPI003D1044CB